MVVRRPSSKEIERDEIWSEIAPQLIDKGRIGHQWPTASKPSIARAVIGTVFVCGACDACDALVLKHFLRCSISVPTLACPRCIKEDANLPPSDSFCPYL